MRKLRFILGVLLLIGGIIYLNKDKLLFNSSEKCCTACSGFNKKYINPNENKCGEFCTTPFIYSIFKNFFPGLVLADEESCSSLGYTKYMGTSGFGIGSFSLKLDRYSKPES